MDPLYGTNLTDMMMANPWAFDPNQQTNQFSPYQNQALPYPMSYNPGLAGGPVNAATGQPIASYQQWKQQNPGGMSINNTPAQPAPAPAQPQGMTSQQAWMLAQQMGGSGVQGSGRGTTSSQGALDVYNQLMAGQPLQAQMPWLQQRQGPGPTGGPAATPQGSGMSAAPNNWQAAINALANPGNPTTPGATVPLATGYQPSGGVNQAFLQQAQGRPNMNRNFLSALSAIQGRPQQ